MKNNYIKKRIIKNKILKIKRKVEKKKNYKKMNKTKLLKEFETSMNGLTDSEAKKRLKKYGLNELPKEEHKSVATIFFNSI